MSEKKPRSQKDVARRLESGGRILSLIRKAESKRVAKRKIIQFLKKKGVSEHKIIEAYQQYYKKEKLYEITFNERPLGFSVIMDVRGRNAIVSSVQDENNQGLGMKVASRMYEVHGKRVDGLKHKDILNVISSCETPFYVVFRESKKRNSKLDKVTKQQELDKAKWVAEDDEEQSNSEESEYEDSDEDSEEESYSYSSDDDEAHVAAHFDRKRKNKPDREREPSHSGVIKPGEIDGWEEGALEAEKEDMMKQLAMLMADNAKTGDTAPVDGMTHARSNTLKLLSQTMSPAASRSVSMDFSVDEMEDSTMTSSLDPEIFKYLGELFSAETDQLPPLTPGTSTMLGDMMGSASMDGSDDEIEMNLPAFGSADPSLIGGQTMVTNQQQMAPAMGVPMGSASQPQQYTAPPNDTAPVLTNEPDEEDTEEKVDLLSQMENGATLMKFGKYGKPKYKRFQLTRDHKYLVWYSRKKDAKATRVPIKDILEILIGKESKVGEKTKNEEIKETSFTVIYGKDKKKAKQLTVTAQTQKEAYVWAQALKILSDAAKKGKKLEKLKEGDLGENESASAGGSEGASSVATSAGGDDVGIVAGGRKRHGRTQSVIISMDHVRSESVMGMFGNKKNEATVKSLDRRYSQLKAQLTKVVAFVMNKHNYTILKSNHEFENVKESLTNIDIRLREVKLTLDSPEASADIGSMQSDLFSINADLEAIKQKITALLRRPKKL